MTNINNSAFNFMNFIVHSLKWKISAMHVYTYGRFVARVRKRKSYAAWPTGLNRLGLVSTTACRKSSLFSHSFFSLLFNISFIHHLRRRTRIESVCLMLLRDSSATCTYVNVVGKTEMAFWLNQPIKLK